MNADKILRDIVELHRLRLIHVNGVYIGEFERLVGEAEKLHAPAPGERVTNDFNRRPVQELDGDLARGAA